MHAQTGIIDENYLDNALKDFKKAIDINQDLLPYGEFDMDLKFILLYYYKNI